MHGCCRPLACMAHLLKHNHCMASIHIILADDDPDECMIFTQVLEEVIPNGKITCVENCSELLDFLEKADSSSRPDLLFLDLNMPLTPGHECLKKIIQNKFYKNIPVIVYSTASRKQIIEECYQIGASMYVVKPTEINKLKESISAVIEKFIAPGN
jgi:CheY-like chemotaxis protein